MDMKSGSDRLVQTKGLLFELVQVLHLFSDSKRFPDSRPRRPIPEIRERVRQCLEEWDDQCRWSGPGGTEPVARSALAWALQCSHDLHGLASRLLRLIDDCFESPIIVPERGYETSLGTSMEQHIEAMWERLARPPENTEPQSSRLPMPHPYVVPGGRYSECYYWDSYFTSLGLLIAGRTELLEGIVANLAHSIDRYGFVPNGTRTYYLSRSQPPFFAYILRLLKRARGEDAARSYVEVLRSEYDFWHRGARVVSIAGSETDGLNRYWDDCTEPRPEGFREDRTTWREARDTGVRDDEPELYRDLRAATESGWDFSSRWLVPDASGRWPLCRIRTTSIIPIDLNCLLYSMEMQLAEWLSGEEADEFRARAHRRRERLRRPPFWHSETGWFHDAVMLDGALVTSGVESLAGVFPLFCRVADEEEAALMARRIERVFLKPGGVVTTTEAFKSGQRWDWPNGWPPLQWITVAGLSHYGHDDLAREIARRFVQKASHFYQRTGAMMEKYDVCHPDRLAGGGEYPNQEGFGWTNGVILALLRFLESGDTLE
jgi:alpha,alpha-trehalase